MPEMTTLVSFNGRDGNNPPGSLLADANGDLFGTTAQGGANGEGTVFEIVKSASGYASTPTILVTFNTINGDEPEAGLIADAKGDLFGTTIAGGANNDGTVFEIVKSASGYASTPTLLVSFNATNGQSPSAGLITDAEGDLFGTTTQGGTYSGGTVFEIVKSGSRYASTPTTLATFLGSVVQAAGDYPAAGLIADAKGDLFGTTAKGEPDNVGTVFEIVKSASGYASTPTTLVAFDGFNGADPVAGLIVDANGDLFGTTSQGGAYGLGTVFEIVDSASGYANTPTTLVTFYFDNGRNPSSGLIADASGDLFGTTALGGANDAGTAFEITDSGYVVACYCHGTMVLTQAGEVAVEDLAIGDAVITASGAVRPIRWIGRRSYAGRFLLGKAHLTPILFGAGSLGNGLPRRDLRVSPAHAMFLDGVLIPASCLVNNINIVRDADCRRVDYCHIELATHDVILAEGAPSETFLDDDSRGVFHNAAEFLALYPSARPRREFCAPRVESGYALEAIRQRLVGFAKRRVA